MRYYTKEELLENPGIRKRIKQIGFKRSSRVVEEGFALGLLKTCVEKRFVSEREKIKILDVGVGAGDFVLQLNRSGFQSVYGADLDDYMREEVRGRLRGFKKADLNYGRLPWPDNHFDILTGWCVFPHLENPHNFIREAARLLKKEGFLLLTSPNIFSLRSRLIFARHGDLPRYKANKNHISVFTKGIFETTVLKYFKLIEVKHFIRTDKEYLKKPLERVLHFFYKIRHLFGKKGAWIIESFFAYNIAYVLAKK